MRDDDVLRKEIYDSLYSEVVGPDPLNPYKDIETGEEILLVGVHGAPWQKYGAGILYPQQVRTNNQEDFPDNNDVPNVMPQTDVGDDTAAMENSAYTRDDAGVTDDPVDLANQFMQSAMGFTFRASTGNVNGKILISFFASKYKKSDLLFPVKSRDINGNIIDYLTKEKSSFKKVIGSESLYQ